MYSKDVKILFLDSFFMNKMMYFRVGGKIIDWIVSVKNKNYDVYN